MRFGKHLLGHDFRTNVVTALYLFGVRESGPGQDASRDSETIDLRTQPLHAGFVEIRSNYRCGEVL
jgi:hypothetical protein